MEGMHRFVVPSGAWPITCADCRNGTWFASTRRRGNGDERSWFVYEERSVELVLTGRLSRWLPRVLLQPSGGDGWIADDLGMTLVVVAHHHRRGMALDLSEDTWGALATLAALGGGASEDPFRLPFDGARLIMGLLPE